MKKNNKRLGALAEELAAVYFQEKGYVILEKNFRAPCGEIDLILQDGLELVFVEVKARASTKFGLPQEAVTLRKQRQITKTAAWYMSHKGWNERPARFDVVAIQFEQGIHKINHIPWAFEAEI